jgi:ankyrin repeat protein
VLVLFAGGVAAATDTRLLEAVKNKDSKTARLLLEHANRLNLSVADAQGMTPLLWAAHWGDLDLVKCLISKGANVRAADRFGDTALHEASTFGDVQMIEALLKAGADPNAARGEGDTPLMVAARSGVSGAVTLLLAHGADVNARDGWYGETPLMLAVNQNYSDVAKILIDHGADVNAASKTFNLPRRDPVDATTPVNPLNGGLTPLFFAARQNAIESGKILIAAGANLEAVEPGDRYTPLLTAIMNDNFDFAKLLIEKGARVDDGALPMVEIMRNGPAINDPFGDAHVRAVRPVGSLELMKLLIAKGAPLDKEFTRRPIYDRNGDVPLNSTALSTAASYVDVDAMHMLLESGAHPVPQRNGMTPLMLVVAQLDNQNVVIKTGTVDDHTSEQAVQICLSAGVDVNAVNNAGETALHYAAGNGLDNVVQILVARGANLQAKTKKGLTPLDWAQGKRPYRGLDSAEDEAPHETTVALLKRLMSAGSTAQNTSPTTNSRTR